jgi:hypothetical protein
MSTPAARTGALQLRESQHDRTLAMLGAADRRYASSQAIAGAGMFLLATARL